MLYLILLGTLGPQAAKRIARLLPKILRDRPGAVHSADAHGHRPLSNKEPPSILPYYVAGIPTEAFSINHTLAFDATLSCTGKA